MVTNALCTVLLRTQITDSGGAWNNAANLRSFYLDQATTYMANISAICLPRQERGADSLFFCGLLCRNVRTY